MRKTVIVILLMIYSALGHAVFLEEFPNLKKFVFSEPVSNTYFGLGLSPVGIMNSKLYMAGNLFQIHWLYKNWDIEIFSASLGTSVNSEDFASSKYYTFRTVPKYRIFSVVSVGLIIGYEFVRFSNVSARLYKNRYVTPYDVFTSKGFIYGLAVCQTFDYGKKGKKIKISQNLYKQTYSTTETSNGWRYLYKNQELANPANMEKIEAGMVFMLEFSYLL